MLATSRVTNPRSNTMSFASPGLMATPSTGTPCGHVLEALEPRGITIRAERDEEIVAQDEKATHCYLIVSGCVRTAQLLDDGRRQVGEFLFAGDLFGWEALDTHDFSAEAVTPVTLRRYVRRDVEALADQDRDVARRLRDISAGRARAGREHMVLLGRGTASERIAAFLLHMAEQIAQDGGARIELPMSRSDMGDYLGLTIETVCRPLTRLRQEGTITVKGATIAIRDRGALCTPDRGQVIH
jgi:CRP-like cAMP-binding protein